jgi:hypothetical protein
VNYFSSLDVAELACDDPIVQVRARHLVDEILVPTLNLKPQRLATDALCGDVVATEEVQDTSDLECTPKAIRVGAQHPTAQTTILEVERIGPGQVSLHLCLLRC